MLLSLPAFCTESANANTRTHVDFRVCDAHVCRSLSSSNARADALPSCSLSSTDGVHESQVLPLEATQSTQSVADAEENMEETTAAPMEIEPLVGETIVPSLMVAEQHGPQEAMDIIQENYMERGYELERLASEAKAEYESALLERGGQ